MRKLSLSGVEASYEGEAERLEPGAYACIVQAVEDHPDREYLSLVLGISEGPRKGFFDAPFFADKPWAHRIVMSYKDDERVLSMLKGRLEVISSWNPGFDAVRAAEAGDFRALLGRKVGVVFAPEERFDRRRRAFTCEGSARPRRLITREDMQAGRGDDPRPRMMDEARKREAMAAAGLSEREAEAILRGQACPAGAPAAPAAPGAPYDDEIPF